MPLYLLRCGAGCGEVFQTYDPNTVHDCANPCAQTTKALEAWNEEWWDSQFS